MPLGDFEVTAAMLEAAFGWVAAGLTGVSAGAVGAVGGAAVLGGYSLWAAENPEDAAEFEQYLAENIVSQEVGSNQQLALNLQAMPSSLKDSIIDYVAVRYSNVTTTPVVPANLSSEGYLGGIYYTSLDGIEITKGITNETIASVDTGIGFVRFIKDRNLWYRTACWFFDGPVTYRYMSEKKFMIANPTDDPITYVNIYNNGNATTTGSIAAHSDYNVAGFSFPNYMGFTGINLGDGFGVVDSLGGVGAGLSGAFNSLIAGIGTAADVAVAGGVEAVYLPNVAINEGVVSVDDAYDASGVTYPDIAITIDGGGVTVPVPEDVLTGLQQIIGLLTPMGIVTGIPPIVQDIDTKVSAIVDTWPGVMDILDGLGLLPPIVQDIADGMGVIIDIPQSLEDITDILLPIPQSLQGLLDGVTIDIPQTLAQILNGTLSIPTAIDGVISGVAALPAAIAGALDIDWVLENTEELKDRLPDLQAPIILPQATFEDLKDIANDYKERTPLGKIFEAYEGTFEVMSTSPQGAPRYEITFPSPINFSFVIDFAIFDGLFIQLAHAFFYLLAIFWYLKFIKRVKSWIDSWLTLGGGFAEVAEEESYAFRE